MWEQKGSLNDILNAMFGDGKKTIKLPLTTAFSLFIGPDIHICDASFVCKDEKLFLQLQNFPPDYAEQIIGDLPYTYSIGGIWRREMPFDGILPIQDWNEPAQEIIELHLLALV